MSEKAFLTHLLEHFEDFGPRDSMHAFREKSWKRLCELGLPSKSHEAFRYVALRELYLSSFGTPDVRNIDRTLFSHAILPECTHSHLVFVDGIFSPELGDTSALASQAVLLPLNEAFRTHAGFLQAHLFRFLKEEKDPFAFVNFALHPKGIFLYVPPDTDIKVPLQFLHIITDTRPLLISPRLHLVLGSRSRMKAVVTTHALHRESSHFHVPALEITLEEGASLEMLNIIDTLPLWHLEAVRATLKKDASLNSLNVTFGGKVVRQSYRISLKGENSEANLNGLCVLGGRHTAHTHAVIEHEAPQTRSMQHFKCALNDVSQSGFEGKILVCPQAQKTQAYQLNKNLILSQGAIATAKPNLEIFADDVKASHGSTISHLDEEQLFYLNARGIDSKSAKHLLIEGFCHELINGIPYDALLEKIHRKIDACLQEEDCESPL